MTISADYAPQIDIGNGTTTAFAVSFPFGAPADLLVTLFDTVANANVTPAPVLNGGSTYDYTVSGTPNVDTGIYPSGTVTFNTAPPSTCKAVRERATPKRQNTSLTNNGPFPAKTVEGSFDRAEMQDQEAADVLDRAVVAPAAVQTASMEIPPDFFLGHKLLTYDAIQRKLSADDPDAAGMEAAIVEGEVLLAQINAALAALGSQAVDFARPTDAYLNAPAGTEADGYRAMVGKAPTGAFAGKRGQLAQKISGIWYFSGTPKAGQRIQDKGSNLIWVSQNGWWNKLLSTIPGAVAQDFADVPDGTLADGLVLATGQVMSCQGSGGAATQINNGRIEPTNNVYNVVPVPYKNMSLWMEGAWRTSHSGSGSLTMSAGQLNGGAIITGHMVHMQHLFQARPTLELWNGAEVTPPLNYLFDDDITQVRETDSNYGLIAAGSKVEVSMMIMDCTVIASTNMQRFSTSYYNDMISGMCGDIAPGDGKGYVYFQSGGVADPDANNPYIYRFIAEPLKPTFFINNPRYALTPDLLPAASSADIPFSSAVELFRYTPIDGGPINAFEIDVTVVAAGVVAGYAGTAQKWRCSGGKFSGGITAQAPAQIGSDYVMSLNASVISLSGSLTQVISGNDILIKYTPSRTGSDATTYDPTVKALIRQLATLTTVTVP